jgi:TonB family protein
MKNILLLPPLLFLVSCGISQAEKEEIAIISCNIMSESIPLAGAMINNINSARSEIDEAPFLGKSDEIFESIQYGLCKELVLNDELYNEKLVTLKDVEEALRIEVARIAEEKRVQAAIIAEEKRVEAERIAEEERIEAKRIAAQKRSAKVSIAEKTRIQGITINAMPLSTVLAVYPEKARPRGVKGNVDVIFTITETGEVEDIRILNGYCRSSDGVARVCSLFNDSAKDAAGLLRFSPIIDKGGVIKGPNKKWTFFFNP